MEIKDRTIWCKMCMEWHSIDTETLWLPKNNGVIEIVCMKQYPENFILLGYDHDLEL